MVTRPGVGGQLDVDGRRLRVSPVAWEEVVEAVRRRHHDVLAFAPVDVPGRLKRHGDLFAAALELQQRLPEHIWPASDTTDRTV